MNKAKKDPSKAPKIPACSGSLESPLVNKVLLNLVSISLLISSFSIKDNLKLLILLSDSGSVRSILPLINISTSSSAFTQTLTF